MEEGRRGEGGWSVDDGAPQLSPGCNASSILLSFMPDCMHALSGRQWREWHSKTSLELGKGQENGHRIVIPKAQSKRKCKINHMQQNRKKSKPAELALIVGGCLEKIQNN